MGNIGDREDDYQEDKTVSIFGEAEEKTVAGQTPPVREEAKETAKAANGKSGGKGLTAIVGAAVAIVGIAAITLWQGKEKAATEAAQTAEAQRLEAEEAEKKRAEEEKAARESEEAEISEEDEKPEAATEALSETAEGEGAKPAEEQKYEGDVRKARELYGLLCDFGEEEGFSGGPIENIYKLFRCHNSGEDIKGVALKDEYDVISYIVKLQDGAPIEETYLVEETESGKGTLFYINTKDSIYCVRKDTEGTIYYDVKADEFTGLIDYWVYDGLLYEEGVGDVGTFAHIYDEIVSDGATMTSERDAYVIDQSNRAFQIYDIYNDGDGRRMEEAEGRFDEFSIPEWEFEEQ